MKQKVKIDLTSNELNALVKVIKAGAADGFVTDCLIECNYSTPGYDFTAVFFLRDEADAVLFAFNLGKKITLAVIHQNEINQNSLNTKN